jgi:hypothetical protein
MPIRIDLINRINMEVIKMDRITELDGVDLDYLIRVATLAQENNQSMKISQQADGTIKIKRGGGMWTVGFGKDGRS